MLSSDDALFIEARKALREQPPASEAEADVAQAVERICRPLAEAAGMPIFREDAPDSYTPRYRDLMRRVTSYRAIPFVLVDWIYHIAQALGEGWSVECEAWMTEQARLLVGPGGQRIMVEYHGYMRYAKRIVAFELDGDRHRKIDDAQALGSKWTTVRADRGVKVIANALRRNVVRPAPQPLSQAA